MKKSTQLVSTVQEEQPLKKLQVPLNTFLTTLATHWRQARATNMKKATRRLTCNLRQQSPSLPISTMLKAMLRQTATPTPLTVLFNSTILRPSTIGAF